MKIALTGRPGVGKSTILLKLREQLKSILTLYGCIVEEVRDDILNQRTGFNLNYFSENRIESLAKTVAPDGEHIDGTHKYQRMSKYYVDMDEICFDMIPYIKYLATLQRSNVLFDEVGKMQNMAEDFLPVITELLKSDNNIVYTVVYNDCETWATQFKDKSKYFVLEITEENREFIPGLIVRMLQFDGYQHFSHDEKCHFLEIFNMHYAGSNFDSLNEMFCS